MLDVDRGDDVDPFVEQKEDVLPPFLARRARHVGVRQLVDHDHGRVARDDGVAIELGERDAAILDLAQRNDLDVVDHRFGVGATVCLHHADHRVHATVAEFVRLLQHAKGLADARRRTDVQLELPALALLEQREKVAGGRFGAGSGHNLMSTDKVIRVSFLRRSGVQPGTSEPGAPVLPPGGVTPPGPAKYGTFAAR